MNITELHNLSAVEKLKIIEALWGDLVSDESSLPSLAWHEAELKETAAISLLAVYLMRETRDNQWV